MELFEFNLVIATFLCSLVAGFLFAFAVVVMPGIHKLPDGEFIRAFQVMDGIIQKNQPLFLLVWVGSALTLPVAAGLAFGELAIGPWVTLLVVTCLYVFAVQTPTMTINIPLNNKLQTLNVETMDDEELKLARAEFEARWNWWNNLRTVVSCVVSGVLMVVLLQL